MHAIVRAPPDSYCRSDVVLMWLAVAGFPSAPTLQCHATVLVTSCMQPTASNTCDGPCVLIANTTTASLTKAGSGFTQQ